MAAGVRRKELLAFAQASGYEEHGLDESGAELGKFAAGGPCASVGRFVGHGSPITFAEELGNLIGCTIQSRADKTLTCSEASFQMVSKMGLVEQMVCSVLGSCQGRGLRAFLYLLVPRVPYAAPDASGITRVNWH